MNTSNSSKKHNGGLEVRMNKKERVTAAIEGRVPDYVPCGFSLHFPKERAMGEEAVAAHLEFF